jgi:hypothetical protein
MREARLVANVEKSPPWQADDVTAQNALLDSGRYPGLVLVLYPLRARLSTRRASERLRQHPIQSQFPFLPEPI